MGDTTDLKTFKCFECGHVGLEYDIRGGESGEYVCPACEARWDRFDYFEIMSGRKQKTKQPKHDKEEPMASKRGNCKKCGNERALVAKGLCGTCYNLARNGGKPKKEKNAKPIEAKTAASPATELETPRIAAGNRVGITFDIEINILNVRIGK